MLYFLGSSNIDENYMDQIVSLVDFMFTSPSLRVKQNFKRILCGGFYIIHGLLMAV
jgi:hypothetical protein